jgi:hypothetical protein
VSLDLLSWTCVLNAPLWCLLLHRAHAGKWQRPSLWGSALAGLVAWMLVIGWAASSVALALTLPLTAVSLAGAAYVLCAGAWPRASSKAVAVSTVLAAALGLVAALIQFAGSR